MVHISTLHTLNILQGGGSPQLYNTAVREQHPRSHHKGATGRVQTGDRRYPVLCQPTWTRHANSNREAAEFRVKWGLNLNCIGNLNIYRSLRRTREWT